MSLTTSLVVIFGGALGSFARYLIAVLTVPYSQTLPWGTIGINILGSFVIGLFGTLTLDHGRFPLSDNIRLFVMVGFCGGFTTFSSFSLQTLDLLRSGAIMRAAINIVVSVTFCILAVGAGHLIAAQANGGEARIAQSTIEEDA